jgi:hypothetical protein
MPKLQPYGTRSQGEGQGLYYLPEMQGKILAEGVKAKGGLPAMLLIQERFISW